LSAQKASIVIPTFNAGPGFRELLGRLVAQEAAFGYEILIVDSGSTDGTIELARRHGASVYRMSQEEFDHGEARNLGISHAEGEYVAFIVQDALPVDDGWLAAMVENLDRDGTVAGVYGRQIPRPDSSPLTRALMANWPTSGPERREQFAGGPGVYREMTPATRRSLATFDNVSSCVRRSVWESIPFERTDFGEDLRWGKTVVEAGYKLVYEPRSAVLHSHERGALYDLRRHYADGLVLQDLFGLVPTPNMGRLLLNVLLSTAHLYLRLSRDDKRAGVLPWSLLLAVRYALCSQVGAYLAARRHRRSGRQSRISARLHGFLLKGI
jgi:rhamnosyltransferase